MERCWAPAPEDRPKMTEVIVALRGIMTALKPFKRAPSSAAKTASGHLSIRNAAIAAAAAGPSFPRARAQTPPPT